MAWTMTTFEMADDGSLLITEHNTPDNPHGKHGDYGFHIKGVHNDKGEWIDYDKPVFVMVHDNTDGGLTDFELKRVAEAATTKTVYWSDGRLCYWMFDFKMWDHWCEMLDVPDEPYYECMHISVYD